MISLFYSSLLFPRCLLSFLFFCVCTVTFPFLFFFFFVLVLSSSLCVFVSIGYDGWYLPGAVHGDELPERRPGSRSPRPRWPASQGPRCPPCRSTQVRKCTQTHTISHNSCCITEYVCMYVCMHIHTFLLLFFNSQWFGMLGVISGPAGCPALYAVKSLSLILHLNG